MLLKPKFGLPGASMGISPHGVKGSQDTGLISKLLFN